MEEEFEEMKKSINEKFGKRESVPKDAMDILKKAIENLSEIYDEYGCNNSSIQEYMYGNLEQAKRQLERIGEQRKDMQYPHIQQFLRSVQNKIEDAEKDSESLEQIPKHKNRISEMFKKDEKNKKDEISRKTSGNVVKLIEGTLSDINSRQSKLLYSRGFDLDRIYQIYETAKSFITRYCSQSEEKLNEIYSMDDEELRQYIENEFDEFVEKIEKEPKENDNKDANKNFRNQMKFTGEFQEKNSNRAKENTVENKEKKPEPLEIFLE